ncbi:HSP90 family protein [Lysinibacter sp. HNR]|uniref:HSP90 family protein n=1 Tax=Lysinibacter sp. HNR TaxID=3031408 RepID=UPI002435B53F|nr:HSP90 family protein [Lysinibacter sp. HNR]WGD37233.1 HSP90 family protein [Lysinibacter sp. HNR]
MPTPPTSATPFQVDLRGVVDLLSRHIYSSPRVFLRELLQNGRDAVSARHKEFPDAPAGVLQIIPLGVAADDVTDAADDVTDAADEVTDSALNGIAGDGANTFVFRDNGIGLTRAEAADLLATVGRSSKRNASPTSREPHLGDTFTSIDGGQRDSVLNMNRDDYLGQFGIGLLSCFMVADAITVRSRSARGGLPIEWVGNADGTFTLRELTEEEAAGLPVGTEVHLTPRPQDTSLLQEPQVLTLAQDFGQYLNLVVQVATSSSQNRWVTLNQDPLFSSPFERPSEELLEFGKDLLGKRPLDAIELVVPGTATRGTAFVLPFSPRPGSRQAHQAYLGGMLLSKNVDDLLPEWAFFVRCVIDTTGLQPTASRESFVKNEQLEKTREAIGSAVRRWIMLLATTDPHRLQEFIQIHSLGLKSLAVHDDELAHALIGWLTIETSLGTMTINDFVSVYGTLRYTATVDEFRQLAPIASVNNPIVNGGYIYDSDLLRRLPHVLDGVTTEQVTVAGELDTLDSPPLADRERVVALENRATALLTGVDTRVSVRTFHPHDLSALYVADPAVLRRIERSRAATIAPGLWSQVVSTVNSLFTAQEDDEPAAADQAQLCLNWANPLTRKLADMSDEVVFQRSIQLLYVQALLAGHRPLGSADRAMLTTAMSDLIQLSVGLDWDDNNLDNPGGTSNTPPQETPNE